MSTIENLKYAKDHTWLRCEDEKAFIGITDYAQQSLGNIVFIELPEAGDEIEAEGKFGEVESVKATSELLMPVSGKVVEVNEDVLDNPDIINKSPYDTWLIAVEMSNPDEMDALFDAAAYQKQFAE